MLDISCLVAKKTEVGTMVWQPYFSLYLQSTGCQGLWLFCASRCSEWDSASDCPQLNSWGEGSQVYSGPGLFLPVSHQSWETDPLVLIHKGVMLRREGSLGPEGPDHQTALEGLRHMGTHSRVAGRLQASQLARGGHIEALWWERGGGTETKREHSENKAQPVSSAVSPLGPPAWW